jgi:hypothetical protein
MAKTKQRNEQHLIDSQGELLLRTLLPRHWVFRQYRPDYGLDYAVEVFSEKTTGNTKSIETLGEHFFVQLKSIAHTTVKNIKIYNRGNVEKQFEPSEKGKLIGNVNVISISLETEELMTIERMGIAVPVLLVVADLQNSKCYFVLLNDYIDKILIPRFDDYASTQSRTIHVPIMNDISSDFGRMVLRWYAKRSKLMSAFSRFSFQYEELKYIYSIDELKQQSLYFAKKILRYDFWDDIEMCDLIYSIGKSLHAYCQYESIESAFLWNTDIDNQQFISSEYGDYQTQTKIMHLWQSLSQLAHIHEDSWREWFLPTSLGYITSYLANEKLSD